MFARLNKIYHEFPRLFWVVVGVSFIDRIGGTLLFPFFALYITQKFSVGMTEAGILLGMSSLFGLIGSTVGGALTDKFGRKQLILFGLVFSAISTLTFGLANSMAVLYPLMIVGIPEVDRVSFSIDTLRRREITITNIRRQNGCMQAAIDLLANPVFDPDLMITHHYDLDHSKAAFDLVAGYRDGVIKAIVHREL
jgi:hypothetical protein